MKGILSALVASLFLTGAIAASGDNLLTDTSLSVNSGWSFYLHKPALQNTDSSGSFQEGKALAKSAA
ncbi:MAG: hypothetical protein HY770_02520, partial [Chitinivibrionia bacterium]|nr:hypothetical protein [Chitinivibrionia bacterium]